MELESIYYNMVTPSFEFAPSQHTMNMALTEGQILLHDAQGRNECCEQQAKRNRQNPGKYNREYRYEAIARKHGAIRILKLHPSNPYNPDVECELIENDSDGTDTIRYEALSWCWGKEKKIDSINIRHKNKIYKKYVQPNLFKALKALRYQIKDRYLWVDAVCIDQESQ